jgi:membrane protease YdiL (CAAX protease family)
MAQRGAVRITRRQAKHQINTFGFVLILYIVFRAFFRYGPQIFTYFGWDIQFFSNWLEDWTGWNPASFLENLLASQHIALENGFDEDFFRLIGGGICLLLITLAGFSIVSRCLHLDIRDYLHNPPLKRTHEAGLTCIVIAVNLLVISVSSLFSFFFRTQTLDYAFLGQFYTREYALKNILYLILYVFIVPLCDEFIFRGVIQRQLGHYGRYFGVLGSAFLYMLAQMDLVHACQAFFTGWVLSLITLRYHSIRPAVRIHIGLSFFLALMEVLPGKYLWALTLAVALIYIVAVATLFSDAVDRNMVRYGATEWKLWHILLTSWTILLIIFLFVINAVLSFLV